MFNNTVGELPKRKIGYKDAIKFGEVERIEGLLSILDVKEIGDSIKITYEYEDNSNFGAEVTIKKYDIGDEIDYNFFPYNKGNLGFIYIRAERANILKAEANINILKS